MPTRAERAAAARQGYLPRAAVARAEGRNSPSVRVGDPNRRRRRSRRSSVADADRGGAGGGAGGAGADGGAAGAAGDRARAALRTEARDWRQEVSELLDPGTKARHRREELRRRRGERLRPRSAAALSARSNGAAAGAGRLRPGSAPPLVPEPEEVRPGTYTLLRDVVPQRDAALDSAPQDGGKPIKAGAPFFVVRTRLVYDSRGEGHLRVKDASCGWISTIDRGGRVISSHTGRHEDDEEELEAQREREDEEEREGRRGGRGAVKDDGPALWAARSSKSTWWVDKDRRSLDDRLAAVRDAERRRLLPPEVLEQAEHAAAGGLDSGAGLRDELGKCTSLPRHNLISNRLLVVADDCFGCGDLERVEAGLARADRRAEQVEREGMVMAVRMLRTYASSLRDQPMHALGRARRQGGGGARPATAPAVRVVADAMGTRQRAAKALVQRAPESRRPSLNAFQVGSTVGETAEVIGSAVYRTDGQEVHGQPHHVDRRRELSYAKKKILDAEAREKLSGLDRKQKHIAVMDARMKQRQKQQAVYDEETGTYKWQDHADAASDEEQAAQEMPEKAQSGIDVEGGADRGGSALAGLAKLRILVGKQQPWTPPTVGDMIAKTVNAKVAQKRQEQLARQQQRLATLRAAAAAAQVEAEATARLQAMFAVVSNGSVESLRRLGLRPAAHCSEPEPEPEPEPGADAKGDICKPDAESECGPEPPDGLSKGDKARWRGDGLPALSMEAMELCFTSRNGCGQMALSLARDRGRADICAVLQAVLCDHLVRAVPAVFGATGGGMPRIEAVMQLVQMVPAKVVRRSDFYDDWMALEEYYKLLLRERADEERQAAEERALEKRRTAEASGAVRRRRREEATARRTEAQTAADEEEAKQADQEKLEARVAAALAEADRDAEVDKQEADTAAWAARRLKHRVKKRQDKGGWVFKDGVYEQVDGLAALPGAADGLTFFDSVAAQVL